LDSDLTDAAPRHAQFTQFLADKDRVSRMSLGVAVCALIVAALAIGCLIHKGNEPDVFVGYDSEGQVFLINGAPFSEAKELHVKVAMLATTVLLSRNPHGFDQPEFLEGMFSKTAFAAATRMKEADGREFLERQIQQKPQIARIDAISNHRDEVQVQVTGEVARWGLVQQAPFTDSIAYTLRLVLRNNPDLLRKRLQPLTVESFHITYASPTR
jgi:hypothetical protein